MLRNHLGNVCRLLAMAGIALIAGACQGAGPTDAVEVATGGGSNIVGTSLSGPDTVHSSGSYQYHAQYSGVYPTYSWWTRNCTNATVAGCSTTWNQSYTASTDGGTGQINNLSVTFAGECPVKNIPTFQVRVIGQGFGQYPDTAYVVTVKCDYLL